MGSFDNNLTHAIAVIEQAASIEGFEHLLNRDQFVEDLVTRAAVGKDLVLTYGNAVFTVELDTEAHEVNIYSLGVGTEAVGTAKQFMKDVWDCVPFDYITGYVKDQRLERIVRKMGWQELGKIYPFIRFIARRPTNG